MQWQRKPWGSTEILFHDMFTQVSRIIVVPGGFSSRHLHLAKANVFVILRGHLEVSTYVKEDGGLRCIGSQLLSPGQSYTVLPGIFHRFDAWTDCEAVECYYAPSGKEISLDDIKRFDTNGVGIPKGNSDSNVRAATRQIA